MVAQTQITQNPTPETEIMVDYNQIIYKRIRRAVKSLVMEKKIKEEEMETILKKALEIVNKHCDDDCKEDMANADWIRVEIGKYIYEADCWDDIEVIGKTMIIDKEPAACNDRDVVFTAVLPTYEFKAPAIVRIDQLWGLWNHNIEYTIVVPKQMGEQ